MKRVLAVLLVLGVLALVGCGGASTSGTTIAPGSLGTAGPTTTTAPAPGDTTSLPTSEATATTATTAAPAKTLSAKAIIASMKASGLPIGNVTVYDENTDPNGLLGRPNQYVDKANFTDTKLSSDVQTDGNGTVEIFANAEDAAARKAYIDEVSKALSMVGYYSYQSGKYLLRVTFDVPPSRAKAYQAAFLKIVKG